MKTILFGIWLLYVAAVWPASLTVDLINGGPSPSSLLIGYGDTVIWINRNTPPARLFEINGQFQSPDLTIQGQSFSYTFTNLGFFAYEANFDFPSQPRFGTVGVRILNRPEAAINSPVEGYYFPSTYGDFPL